MGKRIYLLVLLLSSGIALAADRLNVAVASNMSQPVTEIAAEFTRETGIEVDLTFGSSGNFTRQIIQGAPFHIFLSADRHYVDMLQDNGVQLLADVEYARGRIGLFIARDSMMSGSTDLDSALKMLIHGKFRRLAIANPDHAPYGVAARQALQSAGLWVIEKNRLLLAENAAQATQTALSGNVDAGIIPASFVLLPGIGDKGKFFLIPEEWHEPLQHYLALLAGANDTERQFFTYLQNDRARELVRQYGYITR